MNKAATLTLAVMSVLLFSLYAPLGDATKCHRLFHPAKTRIKGRELTCVYTCKHFFHKKEHEHNGTPCWKLFHPGVCFNGKCV
uniref:Basic tail secreted protein n=1 Tax=Rhipicephalus appendiculatus TaxID=34631 RepID=A0A131Z357_RHIAP